MSSTLEIQHNSEAFDVAVQNIDANIEDTRKRSEGQVIKPAGHTISNSFFYWLLIADWGEWPEPESRYPPQKMALILG